MNADEIERAIARMAHQMVEPEEAQGGLILIGIRRGGESLARRLASKIGEISGTEPGLGFLNINLYRDDDVTHELPNRTSGRTYAAGPSSSSTTSSTRDGPFARPSMP